MTVKELVLYVWSMMFCYCIYYLPLYWCFAELFKKKIYFLLLCNFFFLTVFMVARYQLFLCRSCVASKEQILRMSFHIFFVESITLTSNLLNNIFKYRMSFFVSRSIHLIYNTKKITFYVYNNGL